MDVSVNESRQDCEVTQVNVDRFRLIVRTVFDRDDTAKSSRYSDNLILSELGFHGIEELSSEDASVVFLISRIII